MGNDQKQEKKRKSEVYTRQINVWVTPDLHADLQVIANANGLNLSEFMRRVLSGIRNTGRRRFIEQGLLTADDFSTEE